MPSFALFDQRARAGERLSVVFFGGSLTWGANASDPQQTSYRALVSRKLEAFYPRAHFRFHDAAIGGTGSQLGTFRLGRDVLRHAPDLVLLDFSVNDDPYEVSSEKLASYEAIVRGLVKRGVAVLQIILAVKQDIAPNPQLRPLRPLDQEHKKIARAYNCPVADVVAQMRALAARDKGLPDKWWLPHDGTHPGDSGYAVYADVVWASYLSAVQARAVGRVPEKMLHAPTYTSTARVRFSSLGDLPRGWSVARPNRISAWFDALMSRWLDDVSVAENPAATPADSAFPAPLQVQFRGSTALIFGEATLKSGRYRVRVDGKLSRFKDGKDGSEDGVFDASAKNYGGNMHHVRVVARGLDAGTLHTLEIEPILEPGQELRLESLCVAGAQAQVSRAQ